MKIGGIKMSRSRNSFAKGMGAGMAAGAVMAIVGTTMVKNKKSITKTTGKAVKVVGDIVDDIQMFMK
jgi:formate/nitrite transporter FocA (FNT family)